MATDIWQGLSFDPLTWVEPAPRRGARRPRMAIALAASAAVLAAGAISAWTMRRAEQALVAEAPGPAHVVRTMVLPDAASLGEALIASGVAAAEAHAAVAAARPGLAPAGEVRAALTLSADPKPHLLRLELSNADGSGMAVTARGQGFAGRRVAADLATNVLVRRGLMDAESFYSSAVAVGINDSLIPEFAKALAFDFDFQRDVHRGDAFEAAFEQKVDNAGQAIGPPRLLYAAMTTAGKSAAVYRYTPPGAEPGWFDSSGRSVVSALMRTPVDGARVSSTFGMRTHPVLGFQKLHRGVDFAAAIGTPVYASGNGVIESAVPSDSAGNWIRLRHDNGMETVYMHLNRFMPGIAGHGARVAQGQEIGEVGTTGRSTGPHLHYEVHVGGQPVDPATIEATGQTILSGKALIDFGRERDRIDVARAGQI
ncbi:MAG: peptidoglycan DD-metalloendopeptidase family protein [Sphingomonas fennica]